MIDWKPIAEMPDALKDGRRVLLWDVDLEQPETARWHGEWEIYERYGSDTLVGPTHYAEINAPGAVIVQVVDLHATLTPDQRALKAEWERKMSEIGSSADLRDAGRTIADCVARFPMHPLPNARAEAAAKLDAAFGMGVEQAHAFLRESVVGKRIYDCAIMALIDAQGEARTSKTTKT
jgi:hypothetical protein